MITNQPDIARGIAMRETDIGDKALLTDGLGSTRRDVRARRCRPLRLPQTQAWHVAAGCRTRPDSPSESFMVGDRWRDIEAGRRAGCKTILLGDGYGEQFKSAGRHFCHVWRGGASGFSQQSVSGTHMKPVIDSRFDFCRWRRKGGMLEMYRDPI